MPPLLPFYPTAWQDEALARDGVVAGLVGAVLPLNGHSPHPTAMPVLMLAGPWPQLGQQPRMAKDSLEAAQGAPRDPRRDSSRVVSTGFEPVLC